ncbi:MAG TPA: thioredoxin family protein [Phycisphaerales bacterium]|nr:thioredoxin family protein [Phycisphaerales bacterium]
MRRNLPFLIILLAFAGFLYFRGSAGGVAPRPPMFAGEMTVAEARTQVEGDSKVVLVLATADWCGPCQAFKRGALVDPKVESWVKDNALAVYVDTDKSKEAGSLGVTGIPALIMYRGDKELGRVSGVIGADDLLAWLKMASEVPSGSPMGS